MVHITHDRSNHSAGMVEEKIGRYHRSRCRIEVRYNKNVKILVPVEYRIDIK
jgi:hypothetical protein